MRPERYAYFRRDLHFIKPAFTSRGEMHSKTTYYIVAYGKDPTKPGIGECGIIEGLSVETEAEVEAALNVIVSGYIPEQLPSSVRFGLETAVYDLEHGGRKMIFPCDAPMIPINGLLWMDTDENVLDSALELMKMGFRFLKLKISGKKIEDDLKLIAKIKKLAERNYKEILIRVDANGSLNSGDLTSILKELAALGVESIEQPLPPWNSVGINYHATKVKVFYDEELIGRDAETVKGLIMLTRPHGLVLKPSLLGGFKKCAELITVARQLGMKIRITSMLEGNIGLNAIAQWAATQPYEGPQGLGTGKLFLDNIASPWIISHGGYLKYNRQGVWDEEFFKECLNPS